MIQAIKETLEDLGLDADVVSETDGMEFLLNPASLGSSFQPIEALENKTEVLIERLRDELDLDFDYRLELGVIVLIPLV